MEQCMLAPIASLSRHKHDDGAGKYFVCVVYIIGLYAHVTIATLYNTCRCLLGFKRLLGNFA